MDPMEEIILDKVILLCCTGRSGSTSLQRIINTIPNSNICGENYGAINSLLIFYKKLKQTTFIQVPGHKKPVPYDVLIKNAVKPAWYNSYNFEEIQIYIRCTIINMFKNSEKTNVWGFKEIRYENNNIELLKEFKELFPQTKIIIQIREDTNKQSQSSWFKKDPNSKRFLEKQNKKMREFYELNKEYCYFTTFEKMFDMENMKKIFEFINCKEGFNEEKIKDVLKNEFKST
jgi:hypothetical protein